MLIELKLADVDAIEFVDCVVADINNAIENLVPVEETTSMFIDKIECASNDFATFVASMSQSQRDMISSQIIALIETSDDLTTDVERMFE